jgi:hypothetical protein
VTCIDHHESSIAHWSADECPVNTSHCAAIQTWQHFYPQQEIPFWLHAIDRIDRWDNPTDDDRCFREILNIIAHKPVQKKMEEAIAMTEQLMTHLNDPLQTRMYLLQGKEILEQKDAQLAQILSNGTYHTFTPEYIQAWNLSPSWLGANVFIIDNTDMVMDSTEAAHLVFMYNPGLHAFINYRKKTFYSYQPKPIQKTMYVYSARSRGFDLTEGTIFRGHPTSAGASLVVGEAPHFPFLLTPA